MTRRQAAFALFVLLIAIYGVVGAAATMEPGWIAEAERSDQRRIADLTEIAGAVLRFEMVHKTLPYDIDKIVEAQPPENPLRVGDPDTQRPYAYSRTDEKSYRLCAVFALESAPWNAWSPVLRVQPSVLVITTRRQVVNGPTPVLPFPQRVVPPAYGAATASWSHPAGEHCFDFDDRSTAPLRPAAEPETKT